MRVNGWVVDEVDGKEVRRRFKGFCKRCGQACFGRLCRSCYENLKLGRGSNVRVCELNKRGVC